MLVELCTQSPSGLLRQLFDAPDANELELALSGCISRPVVTGRADVLLLIAQSDSSALRLVGQVSASACARLPMLLLCPGLSRQTELSALRAGVADCADSSLGAGQLCHTLESLLARASGQRQLSHAQPQAAIEAEFLPLCSCCKSSRDSAGNWQRIEHLLQRVVGRRVTHSICPACVQTLYPGLAVSESPVQRERAAS